MSTNRYFSSRPKPCPGSHHDTEMVLLKHTMRSGLLLGKCLSYDGRIFMFTNGDEEGTVLSIVRTSEPDISTDLRVDNVSKAVDKFVDMFIYESNVDINAVSIHTTDSLDSPCIPWSALRRCQLDALAGETLQEYLDVANTFPNEGS